uniref:Uncharacterized protein n=1 Tax=Caenorhabditis japonica TaxID=281687 RepID=A0A8R1I9M7_CAEJA
MEALSIPKWDPSEILFYYLLATLPVLEHTIFRYWQRSEKLARMLAQHREFHSGYQKFWLNWVARHGKRIASKKFVRYDYLGDVDNRFWMTTLGSIFLAICLVFH